MRYAFFSDIHANFTALQTAWKTLKEFKIDRVICLGDVVGYGAEPKECLDFVQKNCHYTVLGNHDNALLYPKASESFHGEAKISLDWTRKKLKNRYDSFLASLPLKLRTRHFTCVHASPYRPKRWVYLRPENISQKHWASFPTPICFIGHTHIPMIYSKKRGLIFSSSLKLDLEDKWIINVGSVGQPRDGDRRLAFGLYDEKERSFELIRVEYDYGKAVQSIRKAGLPVYNSNRLLLGI